MNLVHPLPIANATSQSNQYIQFVLIKKLEKIY